MPHSAVRALPIHKYRYAAENGAVVRQILDALSRHLKQEVVTNMKERMEGSSGTIAGFCVGPDTARLAGGVKMMLEALKQHLTDFNFKDVRDGVVKLRQLGRIMTGSDALGAKEYPPCLWSSTTCVSRAARLQVSPDVSDEDLRHACR